MLGGIGVLFERDEPLALLRGVFARASAGRGHSVLVGGEAGIGKTSLVEAFTRSCDGDARVVWGACEALATPRPLSPLFDIAGEVGGRLAQMLQADVVPHRLFQAFIGELRLSARTTVVVVEDAHWADDASADFLKFVARRIARVPAMLLVTFREEEVSATHPLLRSIADVPADQFSRVRLTGLSAQGVARLAEAHGRTVPHLHALTDGNPLLATELLRSPEGELAASLRDAVLARLQRLSPAGRDFAEHVAVIPDRAERALLDKLIPANSAALQNCIDVAVLRVDREHVRYRHELTRRIVEGSLSDLRRRVLHARVLEGLAGEPDTRVLARLVHHADAAGNGPSVLRNAPAAAAEASRRGAHRQAAAFYRTALRYADGIRLREQATLLERLADELAVSGRGNEALGANARAFDIWSAEGDAFAQGANRQARFEILNLGLFRRGDAEFTALAETAVRFLEPYGVSGELGKAYMSLAFIKSIAGRVEEAQLLHDRAVAVAEAVGDHAALSQILLQGEWRKHLFVGEPRLEPAERALRLSLEHGDDLRAAHAYFCLAMFAVNSWRLDTLERVVTAGLRFAEERDLDGQTPHLRGLQARLALARGDWRTAEATLTAVLARSDLPGIAEFNARMVLGTSYARRGDPRAREVLERVLELSGSRIVSRISKILALVRLAELHWLERDAEKALEFARSAVDESALMREHPWMRGIAVFWRWRIDGAVAEHEPLAAPFAMQIRGDWAGAAGAWAALDSPYERALALIDGDVAAQRDAVAILERIGASAAARRCRELLVSRGVAHVPRGPRPSTRANPVGLTEREFEVLVLLGEGLQNAEIGGRLHRSGKTVAHHVAAILAKLGADSRHEAVRIARAKGLLGPAH